MGMGKSRVFFEYVEDGTWGCAVLGESTSKGKLTGGSMSRPLGYLEQFEARV